MKNGIVVLALAFAVGAYGQVDRSKEIKPTVTERPAVEHFYSCPIGYDLKVFVAAIPTTESITITSTFG